jgi:hypothetical protein
LESIINWALLTPTWKLLELDLFKIIFFYEVSRKDDSQRALNLRIYKTLAIVMCVIFFLYFMACFGVGYVLPLLTNDSQKSFVYYRIFMQLITLAGAINAPVLYICR